MALTDIPVFSLLKQKMQWHQTRQKTLSENVANADTPNFKPHDLREPFDVSSITPPTMMMSSPMHISVSGQGGGFSDRPARSFETTPSGNAVNLEDEMMKIAQNQSDYQMVTTIYQKSLQMLRSAAARR